MIYRIVRNFALGFLAFALVACSTSSAYPPKALYADELARLVGPSQSAIPATPYPRPVIVLRLPRPIEGSEYAKGAAAYSSRSVWGYPTRKTSVDSMFPETGGILPDALTSAIVKSTFYGAELSQCLRTHLASEADVVLGLQAVVEDGGVWKWNSANVQSGVVPAMVIDYFVSSPYTVHGDTSQYGGSTFGDALSPVLNVRVARSAAPGHNGLVAVNSRWAGIVHSSEATPGDAHFNALSGAGAALPEFLSATPREFGVIGGWSDFKNSEYEKSGLAQSLMTEGPIQSGRVLAVPTSHIDLDLDSDGRERPTQTGTANREPCTMLSNLARQAFALYESNEIARQRFASYASYFDPEIAQRIQNEDPGVLTSGQYKVLVRFWESELKMMALRDQTLYKNTVTGPAADTFYAIRAEEEKASEEAEAMIQANLAAMRSGGLGLVQSYTALVAAMADDKPQMDAMAQSLTNQVNSPDTTFSLEIPELGATVAANNIEEMRAKFLSLYKAKYGDNMSAASD